MSCCCDADPCVLCADDFDRGDSTDIDTGSSCGWTERSGAWEILSNRLRCTSSGVATCDTLQTGEQGNYISVFIWADTAGDTAQVVVNLDQDAGSPLDNYDYVEVTFSATVGQIRIMEIVSGGAPNQLAATSANLNIPLSTTFELRVCLRDGEIAARVIIGGTEYTLSTFLDGDEGTSVGLAASVSGNVEFNDWSYERNQNQNTSCNDCGAGCIDHTDCTNCIAGAYEYYFVNILGFTRPEVDIPQCTTCTHLGPGLGGLYTLVRTSGCLYDNSLTQTDLDKACSVSNGKYTLVELSFAESPANSIRIHVTYYITDNRTCEVTFQKVIPGGVDCLDAFEPIVVPLLEDDGNCASGCDSTNAFAELLPGSCA